MTTDLSVVMCTRNGHSRGFIDEAIRSVYQQTTEPCEVILVDDGSTDGTATEVRRAYPDVTILTNTGSGLAAARNTGIQAARCKWIAFIDDDDVWCPTKLSEQMAETATSAQPESTIWAARMAVIDQGGSTTILKREALQFAYWPACLLRCPVFYSGVLLSRELFQRVGLFNEHASGGSAYEYWVRCLAAGVTIRFSKNILFYYRRHPDQMTAPARRVTQQLSVDSLLLPYIERLPQALAARIRTARMLSAWSSIAIYCGLRSAERFRTDTSLRPPRFELRTCAYFALDLASYVAPHSAEGLLRKTALRLLFGDFQRPDS